MKRYLIPLLLVGGIATPALAVDPKGEFRDTTIRVPRKDPPPIGGGRPTSIGISGAGILCTYARGWLKLDLPRGVYSATVTLTSATYQWNGLATTDQPYTEIPELEGRYTIILRTDDSQTYSGSIEF